MDWTDRLVDRSRRSRKYLTYSEWHTDSKFVGLLKVGYQASILEIKFKKKKPTCSKKKVAEAAIEVGYGRYSVSREEYSY